MLACRVCYAAGSQLRELGAAAAGLTKQHGLWRIGGACGGW